MNKIEVFYDGVNVGDYYNYPNVSGITTNISFMRAGGITDYNNFIKTSLETVGETPISFQTFSDNSNDIERDVRHINTFNNGNNKIFVKVPIMNTLGEFNTEIINNLHNEGFNINITSVYTIRQINMLRNCFNKNTNVIISIFAGKIADTGVNPKEIVEYAVNLFSDYPNIRILWAACRSVYNIFEAENMGCHIITVPDSVLKRMNRIGNDLEKMTIDTIKQFHNDGVDGEIYFS